MRPLNLLAFWMLALPVLAGDQRSKPKVDPETREGLLLQQIFQESDNAARLRLLESFSVQFPRHEAMGWVYDQLLPGYFKLKDYEGALSVCERALADSPQNLEFGQICLRSAQEKKSPADLQSRYANLLWKAASAETSGSGPGAEYAQQLQTYAEYSLYSAAAQTPDWKKRLELLQALEARNPKGRYVPNIQADYVQLYKNMAGPQAVQFAEKLLAKDPNNVDMLVAVAEYHFKREDNPERVAVNCGRVLDMFAKARPEHYAEEEWAKRRDQYTSMCNWMAGISNSTLRRYGAADRMLRAALPYTRSNAQMLAAAYYHLGFANYRLAEAGERQRIPDALSYLQQCVAIRGPWQEAASKNIASIRAEYNLQ